MTSKISKCRRDKYFKLRQRTPNKKFAPVFVLNRLRLSLKRILGSTTPFTPLMIFPTGLLHLVRTDLQVAT